MHFSIEFYEGLKIKSLKIFGQQVAIWNLNNIPNLPKLWQSYFWNFFRTLEPPKGSKLNACLFFLFFCGFLCVVFSLCQGFRGFCFSPPPDLPWPKHLPKLGLGPPMDPHPLKGSPPSGRVSSLSHPWRTAGHGGRRRPRRAGRPPRRRQPAPKVSVVGDPSLSDNLGNLGNLGNSQRQAWGRLLSDNRAIFKSLLCRMNLTLINYFCCFILGSVICLFCSFFVLNANFISQKRVSKEQKNFLVVF